MQHTDTGLSFFVFKHLATPIADTQNHVTVVFLWWIPDENHQTPQTKYSEPNPKFGSSLIECTSVSERFPADNKFSMKHRA